MGSIRKSIFQAKRARQHMQVESIQGAEIAGTQEYLLHYSLT
jgi:hypothetical protein